ncbi:TetR family transcriptional regulator [Streptomyces sp. NPDC046716]|uniref:TetR/AcrR family transcriptional regulator n=1 Tax=Streptomyces sp. NPDC046716 TaxID=3157093 RepID=UPI0033CE50E4
MSEKQQAAGTVRRSDATRATILASARERFAADGYERATIRAVARDARIDPSMVMRYFGSKEGLFAAAVSIDLRLPGPAGIAPRELGRTLVAHFLALWEKDEVLTALLRVAATHPAAAERMRGVLSEQLEPVARAVCPDPEQAPLRASLCASQVLGMALTRFVLRFPASAELGRDEVVDWLGPTLQRYLTAETP